MGLDIYLQCGVVIETYPKVKTYQVSVRACDNPCCKEYLKVTTANFCPICGREIVKVLKGEKQTRDMRDFVDQHPHSEDFKDGEPRKAEYENGNIWLTECNESHNIMREGEKHYFLTPEFMAEQQVKLAEYKERNANMLAALSAYGVEFDVRISISTNISY